jgi:hypothetical protein
LPRHQSEKVLAETAQLHTVVFDDIIENESGDRLSGEFRLGWVATQWLLEVRQALTNFDTPSIERSLGMPNVSVYLVRHGETKENRNGIIQGQMETQLNETGKVQGRQVAEALKTEEFDLAISSDAQRRWMYVEKKLKLFAYPIIFSVDRMQTMNSILAYHADLAFTKQPLLRQRVRRAAFLLRQTTTHIQTSSLWAN